MWLQKKILILIMAFYVGQVHSQVIQNPLVRPTNMIRSSENNNGATARNQPNVQQESAVGSQGSVNDQELRQKAENRITQEEFNLRQQELNAATVPLPLSNIFSQMFVSAYVDKTVVLRKTSGDAEQNQVAVSSANQTTSGASSGSKNQGAIIGTQVLRLKVGQKTNLNGYTIRALQEGQGVTVEWLSSQGKWIAVYFGALESAAQNSILPAKESLEKFDSATFDYLRPQVSSRVSSGSASAPGGASQSGFGSAQPSPQAGAAAF